MEQNQKNIPSRVRKVSQWLENAQYRRANKKWLGYSGEIAMRILSIIQKDKQLTQRNLAEVLEVSPQYISKIIQGKENLTLETIAKLSEVLKFELITFPPYSFQATNEIFGSTITGKLIPMASTQKGMAVVGEKIESNPFHLTVETKLESTVTASKYFSNYAV